MAYAMDIELPVLPVETPEFAADPTPYLEEARKGHPWLARFSQGYVVHGYKAAEDLLADGEHLLPGMGPVIDFYGLRGTMWGRFMDEIVLSVSGDTHKRLRSSVAHAFTPRRANREREMMRRVITDLLDEWAPQGAFDFAQFASYFPITVMCGLLGVSAEPIPRLKTALENHLKSLTLDPATKPLFLAAWDVLWAFADTLVKEREAYGTREADALLDNLIAARDAGDLDETELRFMLLTNLVAGFDTSKNMLTAMMNLLLDRPEIYRRCAEDLEFCGKVTREALRHSAIATPYRGVARPFTYDGFRFEAGDTLVFALSLGGRDPSVFADPLAFDPERSNANRHLAFGRGPHICLGQFIAKAQLQEGLHLIAQRLKNPRRTGAIEWRPFLGASGPAKLPIAFDLA